MINLAQIFSHVNPNALTRYLMDDYLEELQYCFDKPLLVAKPHFTCEREMVRDYDKELVHCDGYSYWRTTGRLLVTWDNGAVTAIETRQVPHTPVVIDCGYDEGLPF